MLFTFIFCCCCCCCAHALHLYCFAMTIFCGNRLNVLPKIGYKPSITAWEHSLARSTSESSVLTMYGFLAYQFLSTSYKYMHSLISVTKYILHIHIFYNCIPYYHLLHPFSKHIL